MSGTGLTLVVGPISSVIGVLQAAEQVYDAIKDAEGLPEGLSQDCFKKNLPLLKIHSDSIIAGLSVLV
jgi:hypothetical protein